MKQSERVDKCVKDKIASRIKWNEGQSLMGLKQDGIKMKQVLMDLLRNGPEAKPMMGREKGREKRKKRNDREKEIK